MFFTLRSTYFEQFYFVPTKYQPWEKTESTQLYDSTFWGFDWGLTWQTWIRPGRKATDIPKRLLNPEAYMKQMKLPKGKKKKLLFAQTWNETNEYVDLMFVMNVV